MRRPSRSLNFKRTPWVWSHGDGRGHYIDPNTTPCEEQLTESDYDRATADEIARSNFRWTNFSLRHPLMQFNRNWRAGRPADPRSEEDDQR
eukprot:8249349-Pyramimonas_sp.AAC.1